MCASRHQIFFSFSSPSPEWLGRVVERRHAWISRTTWCAVRVLAFVLHYCLIYKRHFLERAKIQHMTPMLSHIFLGLFGFCITSKNICTDYIELISSLHMLSCATVCVIGVMPATSIRRLNRKSTSSRLKNVSNHFQSINMYS